MKRARAALGLLLTAWTAAALTIWLSADQRCDVGGQRDLTCARGFETREAAAGMSFRWSDEQAEVRVAGLGYGALRLLDLHLRSGRPAGAEAVPWSLGLNGRPLLELAAPVSARHYRLLLPTTGLSGDVARIQLRSATWQPDVRTLGLIVFDAHTQALRGIRWPGPLLILSWAALLLAAQALSARRRFWSVVLPLGLLPLALLGPLAFFLPWLALLGAGSALWWRRQQPGFMPGHKLLLELHWPILCAVPYLLVISAAVPAGSRLPLLAAGGVLAVLGASRLSAPGVLLSALLLRLLLLAGRLLGAPSALDTDVELFYSYGMALREIGLPEVEYPSGALLVWAALSWVTGNSREAFALALPALNIACDILIAAALLQLGRVRHSTRNLECLSSSALTAAGFFALSPLLEPFSFGKYDALPTALAVGALALFAARQHGLAGLALGLGATIKWTPLLAAPFLILHLLRSQRWRAAATLGAGLLLAVAATSLPFALASPQNFLLPYQIQGGRQLTGESLWFLIALALDPTLLTRLGAPWAEIKASPLSSTLISAVQGLVLGGLGLLALLRPASQRRTLIAAALAPGLFLMLNRVFSPQYLLPASAGVLAALVLARPAPPLQRAALLVLLLAQLANMLIWPFLISPWLLASGVLFASMLLLKLWLTWQAAREPTGEG